MRDRNRNKVDNINKTIDYVVESEMMMMLVVVLHSRTT